jgi:hypothetical protein
VATRPSTKRLPHSPKTRRIVAFLREIGISVTAGELPQSFLPGLAIEGGGLIVDESLLEYPGDLLHEAGHLAVAPPEARPAMSGSLDEVPGIDVATLEWAAIPWSYAAAIEIGIDPAVVFHDGGYHGHSAGLLSNFRLGVPVGLHLLVDAGMTAPDEYPAMRSWLRET